MRRGGELCYHSACQSKSPGFETKVVYAMRAARSATRHCSAGPIRGGLGYRWLVSPNGIEPYLSRTGLDLLRSNLCTIFINNNNIYKYRITLNNFFFFFWFFFACLHIYRQFLTDIQLLSWSKLHRAAASIAFCTAEFGIWNVKFGMGIWNGTYCTARGTADWLLARLFLVSEMCAAAIHEHMNSATFET